MAFAASASNVRQNEFTLSPGDTASFAGHTLTFQRMNEVVDSNKTVTQALVLVDGHGPYAPGISKYTFGSNVVGTPSVYSTWRSDVALSLLDVPDGGTGPITLRVTIQPLIVWLWTGGAIMALGTLLAAYPRGRRRGTEPVSAPVPERRHRGPSAAGAPPPPARRSNARPRCRDDRARLHHRRGPRRRRARPRRGAPTPPAPRPSRWASSWWRFVALLATRKSGDQRQPEARIVGQAVPEVQGTTLTGESYDIDARRGNWVVVNFFASWCTPCTVEQPELVRFAQEHAKDGDVKLVSVTFQDTDEKVRAFFDSSGADWPVLVGDTGSIALSFGVTAVPENYLISPDGQVVAKFENVTAAQLDSVLASYTGGQSANSS